MNLIKLFYKIIIRKRMGNIYLYLFFGILNKYIFTLFPIEVYIFKVKVINDPS